MSQYDDLLTPGGVEILRQLYPERGDMDCPLSADVVDDYLNTGEIQSVDWSLGSNYTISQAHWVSVQAPIVATLRTVVQALGPNHHVVVRGTRPDDSTHFFVAANIANRVYAIDAQTRDIEPDLRAYIVERQNFNRLHYTLVYEASAAFTP